MLHGIEHLTKDSDGNIFWKGIQVERFDFGDDPAGIEREKIEAEKMAGVCMWLEEKGMELSCENIVAEYKTLDGYSSIDENTELRYAGAMGF